MVSVDSLPFDVLGQIFRRYEETVYHPLETLLLINRAWKDAALGHREVWSQFKIFLGHYPTIDFWEKHLLPRLDKCGPSVPLDIDIRLTFYIASWGSFSKVIDSQRLDHPAYEQDKICPSCNCKAMAHKIACRALVALAGPQGDTCRRWGSFNFNWHTESFGDTVGVQSNVAQALSYPTPLLVSLSLEGFEREAYAPFHPSAPCLIKGAANLKQLYLKNTTTSWKIELPRILPHLWSLTLANRSIPTRFEDLTMPSLRRLSLIAIDRVDLRKVAHHSLLATVEVLKIVLVHLSAWNSPRSNGESEEFEALLRQILQAAYELKRIEGDKRALGIILKLLWEEADPLDGWALSFLNKEITLALISQENGLSLKVAGRECRGDIEEAARRLGLVTPTAPWSVWWSII